MRKKNNKNTLTVVFVVIMAASLLFGFGGFSQLFTSYNSPPDSRETNPEPEKVPCIDKSQPIPEQYHIHLHLQIIVNGQNIPIPGDIGQEIFGCERVIHTHDDSGTIHIEPNVYQEFTLGDFFGVWGRPFSRDRILGHARDVEHEIVMTVDGAPSNEYENLVLKDGQQIVIEYKSK